MEKKEHCQRTSRRGYKFFMVSVKEIESLFFSKKERKKKKGRQTKLPPVEL